MTTERDEQPLKLSWRRIALVTLSVVLSGLMSLGAFSAWYYTDLNVRLVQLDTRLKLITNEIPELHYKLNTITELFDIICTEFPMPELYDYPSPPG